MEKLESEESQISELKIQVYINNKYNYLVLISELKIQVLLRINITI